MKIGVLFDLDGTLLDTLGDLTDAVNVALAQYHCPPRTLEEVRRFVGNGAKKLIERALPGLPSDPEVSRVLATYQAYYKDHCQIKTKPYEGVPEALAEIGKTRQIAIVTNKPDAAAKALCGQLFPGIYARGEAPNCPHKPDPAMVQQTMKAIGVDTCVYVGDSEVDVITARNAGVACLSVLWGFRDQDLLIENGGKYFCTRPSQMPEIIEKIIATEECYGK